jgi:hypothetical protein
VARLRYSPNRNCFQSSKIQTKIKFSPTIAVAAAALTQYNKIPTNEKFIIVRDNQCRMYYGLATVEPDSSIKYDLVYQVLSDDGTPSTTIYTESTHPAAGLIEVMYGCAFADGSLLIAYTKHGSSDSHVYETVQATNGVWSAESDLGAFPFSGYRLTTRGLNDGTVLQVAMYPSSSDMVLAGRRRNVAGVWGSFATISSSPESAGAYIYPIIVIDNDGAAYLYAEFYNTTSGTEQLSVTAISIDAVNNAVSIGAWSNVLSLVIGSTPVGEVPFKLVYWPDDSVDGFVLRGGSLYRIHRSTAGAWSLASSAYTSTVAAYEVFLAITGQPILLLATSSSYLCATKIATLTGFGNAGDVFVDAGMGITERGIDSSGREYWILGDGSTYYPGGGSMIKKIQEFTSSGSWTCPDGVYSVEALCVGGGGGGSSGYSGGGGAVVRRRIPVVPGTTYTLTIGAGGSAGSSSTAGGAGGTSSFGALLFAYGGGPGGAPGGSPQWGACGTDKDVGTSGSVNTCARCSVCDPRDGMFGGISRCDSVFSVSNSPMPFPIRATAAVANRGTGGTGVGYSGFISIGWEVSA